MDEIKETVKSAGLKHIAVIMDGNRRWAKTKNMPLAMGHKKGVDTLKTITRACKDFGIEYLAVYAFSTENWNRTKIEVDFLLDLFSKTIETLIPEFIENGIKVSFIGSRDNLSAQVLKIMKMGEEKTKNCSSINLQIAFNYGARQEITQAVKNICKDITAQKLDIEQISEETISNYLYTKNIPNPDLLIRTGGEKRISNYLLWQCAYSEIYVSDVFWPDFDENELEKAINEFKTRQRRFGK